MKDYLSEDFSVGPSIANWSPPASPSPPPASSGIAKYFDNKIFMILKFFAHYMYRSNIPLYDIIEYLFEPF